MTAKEMQRRSAAARWSGKSAEEKRSEMSPPATPARPCATPKAGSPSNASRREGIGLIWKTGKQEKAHEHKHEKL